MNKLTIFFVLTAAGCTNSHSAPNTAPPQAAQNPQFQTITLEKAPVSQLIKLPAQLASYEEVSIFPKVNGYVKDVLVDVGSHVKKGQLALALGEPPVRH